MTVTLRQRQKGNKIILYLDYYHKGKRNYENLQLYLVPEPEKGKLSTKDKDDNRKNLALAESIRSKRHLELQNSRYGFQDVEKINGSFLRYFEQLTEKRKPSQNTHGNWDSAQKQLEKFVKMDVTFAQIDKQWLEKLKEFLKNDAKTRSNENLSPGTQSSYFNKVRAALREAVKDGIISRNPAFETDGIDPGESQREFLTLDELRTLANTECEIPILKQAFLFSALTGLRWSDIEKMRWSEVQHSKEAGHFIRFTQKKTKGAETHPISEQAFHLLGEPGEPTAKVFEGLFYSAHYNTKLKEWIFSAKITKPITFHCARHTYATLQLSLGTDIYTVSKLLGHKDLKTTQIYARIIDEKKKEAANRINLIP